MPEPQGVQTQGASQVLPQASDDKMRERFHIGVLLTIVLLAYSNSLWNAFTMDDSRVYIAANEQVTHPSLRGLFASHVMTGVFRPLTFATFALDWKLGGRQPFVFHVVNLMLHAGVTLLLYMLLRTLLQRLSHGGMVAFAAAALFAAHPIHTEAVTSISGRAELLAAGFVFAAWILHLRNREIAALICFVLALLSKESAVAFLPLVLLGDYVSGKWKPALRYVQIAGVMLLYVIALWKVGGGHFGPGRYWLLDNPLAFVPTGTRILNALRVAWKYVALQFYPATLSCDYSFNAIPVYGDWRHTAPAAITAVAVCGAWIWAVWKRRTEFVLAGGIYFAGFATTANILMPVGTIMGERLAYLPSAGFCLLVAFLWSWLYKHRQSLGLGVLSAVVVLLGLRTVVRNRDWRNDITLFSAAARAVPGSAKVHRFLGVQYMREGLYDQAGKQLQTALQINPGYPEVMEAYGLLEALKGNYQVAGSMLENAFYMVSPNHPDYDEMAANLAAIYMVTNHLDGALDLLNREIARSPRYSRALGIRAAVHYKRGELAAASADAVAAVHLDPANRQAQDVLRSLGAQGQTGFPR